MVCISYITNLHSANNVKIEITLPYIYSVCESFWDALGTLALRLNSGLRPVAAYGGY